MGAALTESLGGRTVLVTGAASGIGRAIATLAAEAGAAVQLVDVRGEPLAALAEEIGGEPHVMDVADESAWSALSASTGPWHYVFLNAGIMSAPPDAPLGASSFLTLAPERYRRILAVNVDGVAFGLRAAVPRMREAGGGIVVTASAAGLVPYALDPAYALTKHALVGLVRSLAPTLPPTLRLAAICPGGVGTPLVPEAVRGSLPLMDASVVAAEALDLCLRGENGEVRAKIKADEPAQVFRAPEIALL